MIKYLSYWLCCKKKVIIQLQRIWHFSVIKILFKSSMLKLFPFLVEQNIETSSPIKHQDFGLLKPNPLLPAINHLLTRQENQGSQRALYEAFPPERIALLYWLKYILKLLQWKHPLKLSAVRNMMSFSMQNLPSSPPLLPQQRDDIPRAEIQQRMNTKANSQHAALLPAKSEMVSGEPSSPSSPVPLHHLHLPTCWALLV